MDHKATRVYDFVVDYKRGTKNRMADALSRKGEEVEISQSLITFLTVDWMDDLRMAYKDDVHIQS